MARKAKKKETSLAVETVPVAVDITLVEYPTYQIHVTPVPGLPEANETISKTKLVSGGFLSLPEVFEGEHSFFSEEDKKALCYAILKELDKGEEGAYHKGYYMEADKKHPSLLQLKTFKDSFLQFWKNPEPPSDLIFEQQFGLHMRVYHRQIIFRFFCYYCLGYKVDFVKLNP